jgi:hypothetical protein
MLQHSKIVKSRDEWREKAVERADINRAHRKTKKHDVKTIAALRAEIKRLESNIGDKKNR